MQTPTPNEQSKQKNTVDQSELIAGNDLHIGDRKSESNTINNYNLSSITIIVSILVIGSFIFLLRDHLFPAQLPEKEATVEEPTVVSPSPQNTDETVSIQNPPVHSQETSPKTSTTPPVVVRHKEYNIAISLTGIQDPFTDIFRQQIGEIIRSQGMKCTVGSNVEATQELRCVFNIDQEEISAIRKMYTAAFSLDAGLYDQTSGSLIKSYTFVSEPLQTPDKKRIVSHFNKWIAKISPEFYSIKQDIINHK